MPLARLRSSFSDPASNRTRRSCASPRRLRACAGALIVALVFGSTLTSCSRRSEPDHAATAQAVTIGAAECKACGMVVREQPAPRAQVLYENGERAFFCSIGDMVHYLEVPSSRGAPLQVYVEALDVGEDPRRTTTAEHRWVPASNAHYVLGVAREGVMGRPVLVYATQEEAAEAVKRYGGRSVDLAGLRKELTEGTSAGHHH